MFADAAEETTPMATRMLRRFGFAGFLFFLVKGLLWLAAPFLFAWFI